MIKEMRTSNDFKILPQKRNKLCVCNMYAIRVLFLINMKISQDIS